MRKGKRRKSCKQKKADVEREKWRHCDDAALEGLQKEIDSLKAAPYREGLSGRLKQAIYNRAFALKMKRLRTYEERPEEKEKDMKSLLCCKHCLDGESLLILPKLTYDNFCNIELCPTWGDLRALVDKNFYDKYIFAQYMRLYYEEGEAVVRERTSDGSEFFLWELGRPFCEFDVDPEVFPPLIEQLMDEEFSRPSRFSWLLEKYGRVEDRWEEAPFLEFEMKDKNEIFNKIGEFGCTVDEEPALGGWDTIRTISRLEREEEKKIELEKEKCRKEKEEKRRERKLEIREEKGKQQQLDKLAQVGDAKVAADTSDNNLKKVVTHMRTCSLCGTSKPTGEFSRNQRRKGPDAKCNPCVLKSHAGKSKKNTRTL